MQENARQGFRNRHKSYDRKAVFYPAPCIDIMMMMQAIIGIPIRLDVL